MAIRTRTGLLFSRERAAAAALAVAALVSTALGAARTVPHLLDRHDTYATLSDAQAERAGGDDARLSAAVFAAFRAALAPGDRYYVHTPAGGEEGFIDRGRVVRSWAAYYLLPAVQVARPAEADVVLAYDANPRALPVRLREVRWIAGETAWVARVAR